MNKLFELIIEASIYGSITGISILEKIYYQNGLVFCGFC